MSKQTVYPKKVEELAEGEAYYALVNETYSSNDGYDDRHGGGWITNNYINIIHLGNQEQALKWLYEQEASRDRGHYKPSYKIVIMKPCAVQRSVSLSI